MFADKQQGFAHLKREQLNWTSKGRTWFMLQPQEFEHAEVEEGLR